MKVAIIGYQFCNGGLEKVMSNVSILLDNSDIEVYTIVLEDKICYEYGGKLINLGKHKKISKYLKLNKILRTSQFDYIIDFRYRLNPMMEIVFISFLYRNLKVIYTIHSAKLEAYFTSVNWVAQYIISKVHQIVAVSNGISKLIAQRYKIKEVQTIYNFSSSTEKSNENKLPYDYIIAAGRLDEMKQFDQLIESYSKTSLPSENIHLVILGEGIEKEKLMALSKKMKIEQYVHLLGFIKRPSIYYENAKFLVLSSRYEGFGMVLLEALALGTPVISFDCEVGPNEIIRNNKNGILVPDQDFNALTLAIDRMYSDKELYLYCKKNAKSSVNNFTEEVIKKQWLCLLKME